MNSNTREEWLRLHLIPGLGRRAIFQLIRHYGTPAAALAADSADWRQSAGLRRNLGIDRQTVDAQAVDTALLKMERIGARLVSFWDKENYPAPLRTIPDPPALLYILGNLQPDDALAVVGSRKASNAGLQFAEQVASDIAAAGISVVSGLARGIDAAAHRGALSAAGHTLAVLGCGIDRIYPAENRDLFYQLAEQGAIISEYPLGTRPLAGHFPGRNRIISGLSQGVLVVEAAIGSGSLLTADFALESGREVFAVPNQVHTTTSAGVNQLIKDGARVVTETRDITEVLWPDLRPGENTRPLEEDLPRLAEESLNILKQLSFNPVHRDELQRISGLTPMELSDRLLHLELSGCASQLPGGYYIRAR